MIYGNAVMLGGGGGGITSTDAILRVQAPAGSTVTISKGAVSKSDLGHENATDPTLYDYYFIIHQSQFDSVNPWTVTATLGTDSDSDTIIIDAADEYDVELSYRTYLFKSGVGEIVPFSQAKESGGVITVTQDYVELSFLYNSTYQILYRNTTAIDLTGYTSIGAEIDVTDVKTGDYGGIFWYGGGVPAVNGNNSQSQIAGKTQLTAGTGQTVLLDISSFNGNGYLGFKGGIKAKVYSIFLQ